MDRPYKLSFEESGVFLEVTEVCARKDLDAALEYIKRKKIDQLKMDQVLFALEGMPRRVCIAPAQTEYIVDEQALITVSGDQMEAEITLLPPDEAGERLTFEKVMREAASKGVVYGLDGEAIRKVLELRPYGESVCIAKGLLPEDGKDGENVFHFKTELIGELAVDEKTGKVDYKNLNLFEQVKKGQLLVTRTLATQGKPGTTVTGRPLKQKAGKETRLPSGKNVTYDENRMNMFASVSGRVDYKNRTVSVASRYVISGDADLSVGNISFDGDVVIKGNVISEISIQAAGDIEVYGTVEGTKLTAGGNIILRSGIQGNDKGILEAGGDVISKYIERTRVLAGGSIKADALIHCHAESGNVIVVKGRHGSIIGGNIKAQNSITAQNIGSVVNNKTNIEVGIPLAKRARLKFLGAEIERLQAENGKFAKIVNYISHIEKLSPDKEQMKRTVIVGKVKNAKLISDYSSEMRLLEEDIKGAEAGKIHVTDTIFPGVKLTISMGEYTVTTPIKYSTFYCKNREVLFTSCQI
jgi:uncharacterized protein (DUF342 family)